MTRVRFTQVHIDARELASADLQKVGVEGFTKRSFGHGEAVEVSEEVAIALIENPDLFGQFELVEEGASTLDIDDNEEEAPTIEKTAKPSKNDAPSASAGQTSTSPSTTTSTGKASTR